MTPFRPLAARPVLIAGLLLTLLVPLALSGCGGGDPETVPVAEVEGNTISLAYYERKMNKMGERYLPEVETHDGRMELLETMINKEVMAIKAAEFGMDADGRADESGRAMAMLMAVQLMKDDMVQELLFVSHEEVQEYYENLGRNLRVSYMVFDYENDALEARDLVLGGEQWNTVADRVSVGDPGPNGDWTTGMTYGTLIDDVERRVYELSVGDITEPIESAYGWFLVRVDGQVMGRVPPLDSMRDRIIESVHDQKKGLATIAFIHQMMEEYDFQLNGEAVDSLYVSLPPDLTEYPPPPREELARLNMHPSLMDMELMSYADETWTMRRYYDFYHEMGPMARPQRVKRVGGLRRHLQEIGVRELLPVAARDRGYLDRPEIVDEQRERKEQAMVHRLHNELIMGDVEVTDADIDTFWTAHKDEYRTPERRKGLVLVAATEQEALAASLAAKGGVEWEALVAEHGLEGAQPESGPSLGPASASDSQPVARLLFQVDGVGDVSFPAEIESGGWAIVRLDEILPEADRSLPEVGVQVKKTVERLLADRLFNERVDEWKQGMLIRRYPKNVDKAVLNREDPRALANPPQAPGAS